MKLSSPEARADATEMGRAVLLMLIALVAGCWLRFSEREIKPMHTDEATQALKLKDFMAGEYDYAKPEENRDHHGPASLYLTLPVKWFSSASEWKDLTESQIRLMPALCGLGLLLLLAFAADGFSRIQLAWGALFVAVSPVLVFYSRYYIMEMLLASASMGCIVFGWRYWVSRNPAWLTWAGICAGVMHGTKETCVFHFAAMAAGIVAVWVAEFFTAGAGLGVVNRNKRNPVQRRHLLLFVIAAVTTSVMIYSQGFRNWGDVWDSIAWYFHKGSDRASGEGHQKAFGYYFGLLWGKPLAADTLPADASWWDSVKHLVDWSWWKQRLGFQPTSRTFIGEPVLVILAGVGVLASFVVKPARYQSIQLLRFLSVYGVVLFLIYSMIPYKTPWLVISAWAALLLPAGVGAHAFVSLFESKTGKSLATAIVVLGTLHAGAAAWRASRDFAGNGRNPYNYSMTSPRVEEFVRRVRQMAELKPADQPLRIEQADINGAWPLPWHFRQLPGYRWTGDGRSFDDMLAADIVITGPEAVAGVPESIRAPQAAAVAAEPVKSEQAEPAPAVAEGTAAGTPADKTEGAETHAAESAAPADKEAEEDAPAGQAPDGETKAEASPPAEPAKPAAPAAPKWFPESLTPNTEPRKLSIWTRQDLWDAWMARGFSKDTPVQK